MGPKELSKLKGNQSTTPYEVIFKCYKNIYIHIDHLVLEAKGRRNFIYQQCQMHHTALNIWWYLLDLVIIKPFSTLVKEGSVDI